MIDEDYWQAVAREQNRQIASLASSLQTLAIAHGQLLQRVQILEAYRAVEQMDEVRTVN